MFWQRALATFFFFFVASDTRALFSTAGFSTAHKCFNAAPVFKTNIVFHLKGMFRRRAAEVLPIPDRLFSHRVPSRGDAQVAASHAFVQKAGEWIDEENRNGKKKQKNICCWSQTFFGVLLVAATGFAAALMWWEKKLLWVLTVLFFFLKRSSASSFFFFFNSRTRLKLVVFCLVLWGLEGLAVSY